MEQWDVKGFQKGFRMEQRHRIAKLLQKVTTIILPVICLAALPLTIAVKNGSAQAPGRTVVLDPGHGGSDTGVKGPGGTLEKDVALRLTRLIANRLKDRYQVVLTRTGDYVMERADRTGNANNVQADLFVSIHAAGSYSPATRGLQIYYYAEPAIKAPDHVPGKALPWRKVQNPHSHASNILAQRVWERTRLLADQPPGNVLAVPAAVLAGADMPAILIEAGYLTSPKQERNLKNNKYLFKLATAISRGIDDFFHKPDTIASTDLRE